MDQNIFQESSTVNIYQVAPILAEPNLYELLHSFKQEHTSTGYLNTNPMEKLNLRQLKELLSKLKRKSAEQKRTVHEWMSKPELLINLLEKCKNNKFEFGCASQTRIITNGKGRIIYSYRIQDKIIQKFISLVLNELFDDDFFPESFGYRPLMSIMDGIELMISNSHNAKYALKLDIQNFFPSINTNVILSIIEKKITNPNFLRLIRKSMNTYCKINGKKVKLKGLAQGAIPSPVCSSILLNHILDNPIRDAFPNAKLYRYADDLFILFSEERYVNEITVWVENTLKNHNLNISEEKTPNVVSELRKGQQFLGYKVGKVQEQLVIDIDQDKIKLKVLEICLTRPEHLHNYLRSQLKSTNISKETHRSWYNILVDLPTLIRKELITKVHLSNLETILAEIDFVRNLLLRELSPQLLEQQIKSMRNHILGKQEENKKYIPNKI
ncbi:reverse transcriptase/maturase family protein [Leptospira bouyouniensis]|nr:reverse transcriptase/maturase family protein [Leptospira bouyouniensis]